MSLDSATIMGQILEKQDKIDDNGEKFVHPFRIYPRVKWH